MMDDATLAALCDATAVEEAIFFNDDKVEHGRAILANLNAAGYTVLRVAPEGWAAYAEILHCRACDDPGYCPGIVHAVAPSPTEPRWLPETIALYRCRKCGRNEYGCECEGGGDFEHVAPSPETPLACAVCGEYPVGTFPLCGVHGRYGGVDLTPLAASPETPGHVPGDPHRYVAKCVVCGVLGSVVVSMVPALAAEPKP